jgi:glycosyltransferase involved in cell wall biosynthesis
MRVLYVLERYPELSQTFIAKEIEALIVAGVDVSVAAIVPGLGGDAPAPAIWTSEFGPRERLIEACKAATSAPAAVARQITREASWPPPGGSRRLRGLLRLAPLRSAAVASDHIHAHFATEATDMARLLAALSSRPFSFTAHGADAYSDPAALAFNIRAAAFARACSGHVAERLRAAAPDRSASIVEIGVAVDVEAFARAGTRQPDGPIVAVGRLVEKKGFDDLIDCAATGVFGGRRLQIIGDGPLRGELEAQVRRTGAMVDLLGALDHRAVAGSIQSASLFALTPKTAADGDRDGRPTAIVEAMAAGLPILSTSQPGIPELVSEDCGRLATPGNLASIADAARDLLALPDGTLDAMGEAGARRARDLHRPDAVASRLEQLFNGAA